MKALVPISFVLFVPLLGLAAIDSWLPVAGKEVPQVCHVGCDTCSRTITSNHVCQVGLYWDASFGRDGCCLAPPPIDCPDLRCLWAGTLTVVNTSTGGQGIDIHGPGPKKSCPNVPPGGTCEKFFGGTQNPDVSSPCDDVARVLVEVIDLATGNVCQANADFNCAACQ